MAQATQTLYEKLGGKPAVEAVVGEFYKRVLSDSSLKSFFDSTDMGRQKQHQVNFISMALGGPNQYSGRSMRKAHETLKLTENHFNSVAGHLVETLKWAKVEEADINAVVETISPLKDDIVTA